ncbi:MAG: ACP S-malonyltransferase [Bacteroidetes bacterium]|nr:ACP S-malonyltransferase [Bacteroidota bacterium]
MKAYVFPGQGSQYPGMGYDLYKNNKKASEIFKECNDILKFDLTEIMFSGNEEELKSTNISQLAIFTHSYAIFKSLNLKPTAVAGHSLGEYSALAAIDAIELSDCLNLIKERALAMKEASNINPGKMAAVIGLSNEKVGSICKNINQVNESNLTEKLNKSIVFTANYNCPGQIVIAGNDLGIKMATEELKKEGARRIVELKVSGAFHTIMMMPAKERFKKKLDEVIINKPSCPIYQNVDAKPSSNPKEIKIKLLKQLVSPVYWTQTIQNMISDGYDSFEEIGPGKVLKGLIGRIDKNVNILSPPLFN